MNVGVMGVIGDGIEWVFKELQNKIQEAEN